VITQAVTITDGTGLQLGPETIQLSSNDFTGSFDQKKFYVVKDASGNLSKGKVADYTADAKGKIAIVKRGELTFADKQKYAQAAGAAGLIIVNNDGTATPVTSMALTTTFPTFGLSSVTGQKLVDWVTAHPDDSLGVKIALTMVPNQKYTEDKMSDFTSYGPVSNLSFKPDITAPGGNIWSTQNNNGYTNMSGTSMASPFIAGSQALLKQALNNKNNPFYAYYKQLKGTALTDFLKTVEMNTAQPINDINYNNVIVSPRRQGAGLVDVKAAIDALEKNPSTVVAENGYPAVELKDFTSTDKTFKLTFTNRTTHELTYQMDSNTDTNAVYTSATDPNSRVLYDKK
ncbi:S8 family serine peptidase, partial [Streptomyces sp. NPDC006285]